MIFMATTSIWLLLFYSSSIRVPLRTTTTTGYNHQYDRPPCASLMIFMATTSIWLLLFYSSSVSVPLLTTTTSGPQDELQQEGLGTLNRWREHDFLSKTNFYAIVKIKTHSSDDHPHDRRLRMRNDIHGNHKHLATVVLFLKYKCATSYNNHIRR